MIEPIRCPKCTEHISVEDYEAHLQTCPNDYCPYCKEPFPKEYLSDHKAHCPQRSTQRPATQRSAPRLQPTRGLTPGRQVTRRQTGLNSEEIRTVDILPDGSQRVTVESIGPFGRQISMSTVPAHSLAREPVMSIGAFSEDFDEPDPFELLFVDHQRFMRLNRPNINRQVIDLEALLLMLIGRIGPQQRGLRRETIDKIARIRFKKSAQTKSGEEEKCSICISEFADQEELRQLPCSHLFHPECVDTWLVQNTNCPVCKADIRELM